MPKAPWAGDALYRAAALFVDECLRRDGSLFTPGREIWAPPVIDEFFQRFLQFEMSDDDFMTKLKRQLEGLSPEAVQLAGEAFFVHLLAEDDTGAPLKTTHLEGILALLVDPLEVPVDLAEAFPSGLARIGVRKSKRDQELRFLLQFALDWKREIDDATRERLLDDRRAFEEFVRGREMHGASYQVEALLHLVFPDFYEPVVSRGRKRKIVDAFALLPDVATAGDLDSKLAAIRSGLSPLLGESFTFYRSSVRGVWDEPAGAWTPYVDWAQRLLETPSFDSEERDYKLEVAANVAAAREALPGDDWLPALRRAFGPPNNLTNWREHDSFLKWAEREPGAARELLDALWNGDYRKKLRGSLHQIPADVLPGRAARASIASYLLLGVDVAKFPMFRHQVYERTCKLVGRRLVGQDAKIAELYDDFVELLDEVRLRLLARGVQTRDRLDAQSVAWWIASSGPPDEWSEADKAAFLEYKKGGARVTGPTQAWLVRGEKAFDNNLVPRWLDEGFVSFGDELDIGIVPGWTRAEIVEHISGYHETMGSKPDSVHRFVTKMRPGDLLLTVDGDNSFLGLVSSEVEKDEDEEPGAVVRRTAEWLNSDAPVSRNDLPQSAKRLMKPPTVIDMTAAGPELARLVGLEWGEAHDELTGDDEGLDATQLLPHVTSALAAKVHFDVEPLQEIADLLEEKKQLVFYGPPGTGKTLVAQRLAEHLTSGGGDWHLAQFHPSYSYEDFMEGFRPVASGDDGVAYALKPGPLRRIAEDARDDPDNPYILIVDEINRGNIPKIFGELLFLLEYRDRAIELQYADEPFSLPSNLFLIGTMNTADRSIALVDAALRRRFYFIPFLPQEEPVKLVLRRWLVDRKRDDDLPARLLDLLNERIAKDEVSIGPSYLMTGDGSHASLTRIWRYAIMPLLEEHYYGSGHDVVKEFGLSALLARLQEDAPSEDIEQVEQG